MYITHTHTHVRAHTHTHIQGFCHKKIDILSIYNLY